MNKIIGALFVLLCSFACLAAGPNVLNNSNHSAYSGGEINALLGSGVVGSSIYLDMTQPSTATPAFLYPGAILADATNTSNIYYGTGNNTPDNHAPYRIVTTSASGYSPAFDLQNYAAAVAGNVISNFAFYPGQTFPAGTGPPTAMTVVDYCTDTTAGWGDEFCITPGYLQADQCYTGSPSDTTNCFAQLMAVVAYQHPAWNNFDLIGAFRETAANWATGYAQANYGYGAINYTAATAIASSSGACAATGTPASICLQPPGLAVINQGTQAQLILYPNRTTRRKQELIYSVSPSYNWPVKNEYTTADITASRAKLLYTSNGTDIEPVYNYVPSANGSVAFVAFTTDGQGNYSRVESQFSVTQLTFSAVCPAH